mgnify:CR=1 FL=1
MPGKGVTPCTTTHAKHRKAKCKHGTTQGDPYSVENDVTKAHLCSVVCQMLRKTGHILLLPRICCVLLYAPDHSSPSPCSQLFIPVAAHDARGAA